MCNCNMKKISERLEFIGLVVFGAVSVIVHRLYPDRPLLYALLLLPAVILLAIASFLHMRLPRAEKEPVRMVFFDTHHLYLTFLLFALAELFCFLQVLQEGGRNQLAGIIGVCGIITLLVGEIISYVVYYRQQKENKSKRTHGRKRRK